VHVNRVTLDGTTSLPAAKRRKNAAHGASHGEDKKRGNRQAPAGRKIADVSTWVRDAAGFAVAESLAEKLSWCLRPVSSWTDSASGVSAPSFSLPLS